VRTKRLVLRCCTSRIQESREYTGAGQGRAGQDRTGQDRTRHDKDVGKVQDVLCRSRYCQNKLRISDQKAQDKLIAKDVGRRLVI
jgi:hypothetical protein